MARDATWAGAHGGAKVALPEECQSLHLTGRNVAIGATHKVTAKQTGCSFVSAQLHIHHLLTSSNTKAFPTWYQGELSGHAAFPHPNKILLGAAHRGSAQSPPAHGRKATSHRVQKWQKPPVRPFIFPGQYPMAKLKINISLASSTTQPTLDNSCRGLASCWRYNPSVGKAIFSRRHPGRYRKGGKKGKNMSLAQIFLIPGYHLHDQKQPSMGQADVCGPASLLLFPHRGILHPSWAKSLNPSSKKLYPSSQEPC